MHRRGNRRSIRGKIGSDVMFESVLADIVQEFLHLPDFDHARSTEGVERVVGEPSLTNVATHLACRVVGGEACKAHLLGLDQSDTGAESVLLAYRTGNDFLKIHLHRAEKMFG